MDCLFCKIIEEQIPSDMIYKDERVVAFSDIHPKTPVHKLIVPRKHIATMNELQDADTELMGHMLQVARKLAAEFDIAEKGYRLVINTNQEGGQEIYHLHVHLLGGRQLAGLPG